MNTDLIKLLNLPYFRVSNVEAIFSGLKKASVYQKINRWSKKGDIIKLKKGYYTAKEYKDKNISDFYYVCYLANNLRYPSYISGAFVLQNNNVLTDIIYPITSITTKSTRSYSNKIGDFVYNSVSKKLYTGFERHNYNGEPVYIATLAKALFDYLYIKYFNLEFNSEEVLERERFNLDEFKDKDIKEFCGYCMLSKKKWMIDFSNLISKLYSFAK